jgi:hypothetical protein
MRTAIFLGACVISFGIRPDAVFPVAMGMYVSGGLIAFIIMDTIDFIRSLKKEW